MNQLELCARISRNSEKFNEDLIFYRDREDPERYIREACESLLVVPGIEFLGCHLERDETKMNPMNTVNVEESRLMEVTLKFRVTLGNESEDVTRMFYVPKIIDNTFLINGTRYYPIFQIIDNAIFVTGQLFSLKTSLMPIRFKHKKSKVVDMFDNVIEGTLFTLTLFKQNISVLYYYLARFGLNGTVKFFGFDPEEDFFLCERGDSSAEEVKDEFKDEFYAFEMSDEILLMVKKSKCKSPAKRSFVIDMVHLLSDTDRVKFDPKNMEGLVEDKDHPEYWLKVLGKIFTVSNQVTKAQKILFSLERITDTDAARNRLDFLDDSDKENIYCVIRWMLKNFETLKHQDNKSLRHKRVQCWEYLLQPLLLFFSNATYRLNNTRNPTIKTLSGIFNIGPNFLLKRLLVNELIRYSDVVNDLPLFSSTLKVTFKGQGSIISRSGMVSDFYRESHPTYLGNLSVVSASNGDPGMSTTISPFTKIVDGRFVDFPYDQDGK